MTGRGNDHVAPIRTFCGRTGRVGPAGRAALRDLWTAYGVDADPDADEPLTSQRLFGHHLPLVIEIGSGMGEATAAMAAADPHTAILAIEVHTAGVAALLRRIVEADLANVRVLHGDAVTVLESRIPPDSLAAVRLFFPDPWPKARHAKRRFVRPDLIALTASRLAPGGLFHAATDWSPYADVMLEVLTAEPLLMNTVPHGFAPRPPERPVTRFERKGLSAGHEVRDLVFRRIG